MTKHRARSAPAALRPALDRTAKLDLTESELELLEVEMRNAIECGAEDEGFPVVHKKAVAALQKLRATK